jgi:predicted phosphoribosyltransferase
MALFRNRRHAGFLLGQRLRSLTAFRERANLLILGLPSGGVPVAFEVAKALAAPLDVFVVRKLGVPGHEELAMGALASGGIKILSHDLIGSLGIDEEQIARVVAREERELARRESAYRSGKLRLDAKGKYIILVDDGLATGATMRAAIAALRQEQPEAIAVAVPVAPASAAPELDNVADNFVSLHLPQEFYGVGLWYEDFSQTDDDEVRDLLRLAEKGAIASHAPPPATQVSERGAHS